MSKLTGKRVRILQDAAKAKIGITNPYIIGWERVSWDKNARYLSDHGLIRPYVHGGYEITDAGRAALAKEGE